MENLAPRKLDAFAIVKDTRELLGWNETKQLVPDLGDHSLFHRYARRHCAQALEFEGMVSCARTQGSNRRKSAPSCRTPIDQLSKAGFGDLKLKYEGSSRA